jgi:hypothetical protein
LDAIEVCKLVRELKPDVTRGELRTVLPYFHNYVDSDKSGAISLEEFKKGLEPFMPLPPTQDYAVAVAEYTSGQSPIFMLLHDVTTAQPANLPSVFATQARAAGGNANPNAISVSSLPTLIYALVPGVPIAPRDVTHVANMATLDTGAASLSYADLNGTIEEGYDGTKRASAINRMILSNKRDGVHGGLETSLGGLEVVFSRLAVIFNTTPPQQVTRSGSATLACDNDSSNNSSKTQHFSCNVFAPCLC